MKYWVYLGQAFGKKYPTIERFIEVDENQQKVGNTFAFKKFKKTLVPGGIYNVDQEETDTLDLSKFNFSGKLVRNQNWLSEIQTEHQLYLTEKKMKSLEAKFRTEYKLMTDLTMLAVQYRKLWGTEKLMFEWMVIAKLRELAGKA
jgi:hypothetical protein